MLTRDLEGFDPKEYIIIRGARVHNLKNLDVAIPKNKLVVITGLSGSGKSSLAFDTLYAEGQRRYVESLSSYARQFLGRMSKPEVDAIQGIAPAIAIEQRINTRNPRSTVGTSTEIYDYLKLLFARIGKTYSPISGKIVERHQVHHVVDYVRQLPKGAEVLILFPLVIRKGKSVGEHLSLLMQQGFTRIFLDGQVIRLTDQPDIRSDRKDIRVIIDRIIVDPDDPDLPSRLADSAGIAFHEGHGSCIVMSGEAPGYRTEFFSNRFESDGMTFEEPTENLFSFNNPFGACKTCEGFGSIIGIDENLVVPNKSLSIYEDAIACWRGEKMSEWKEHLLRNAHHFSFPVHKPYYDLSQSQKELLWTGNSYFSGLKDFFAFVEEQSFKIQYRVILSRYRGKTVCPDCRGTRLRKDAQYVKVGGKSISDLVLMHISSLQEFFNDLDISSHELHVAGRILTEIRNRLQYLTDVGVGYLTLNRLSSTLSGGESQRIRLATSLGSSLVGSIYILDEPSIGLHPRDTHRLIKVLKRLRDQGNTVIVVEHDEEIIRATDELLDIGPMAGVNGGQLVFQGTLEELLRSGEGLTSGYLSGRRIIPVPASRRRFKEYFDILGARENNLKGIDVRIPLNIFTVVTGVSGSGKTSLVRGILYPALKRMLGGHSEKTGLFNRLDGDISRIADVQFVDQNPIGRSSRSNPATYIKAYDDIRNLFAEQPLSKVRGYKPGYFSFNVEGGRCEDCEGEGTVRVEMQFMADIFLTCESCGGKRFKEEVLDIRYKDMDIYQVLNLTVNQAIEVFGEGKPSTTEKRIVEKLLPLKDVGLGYLGLGQPSSTLSGGEAQRVKLASFLTKGASDKPTLFIFDEPTTGLHFHDIGNLLAAFDALIEKGHSIMVIEHNMEIVKCADWIIDLGPEGGDEGGEVVFTGTPEEMMKTPTSHTALFLKGKIPADTDRYEAHIY
ncbi:MAG: excinuclease ABC subunit UvrA [Bacteroidales bacterium]|nr:excinuclease ABC subunit UvrA [Bacteroidales bacterium]